MYRTYERRQPGTSVGTDRSDDSIDTPTTTNYRSAMGPRVTNVTRSRPSGLGAGNFSTRMQQTYLSTGSGSSYGFGLASLVQAAGVPIRGNPSMGSTATVPYTTNRQRDKRDLATLNDKFAQYVEKVRFLEAQNRKLALELEALQSRAGQGTSRIKEMYDIEMAEANKLIDDTKRDAANASARAAQLEDELNRKKIRNNELSNLRAADQNEIDAIQRQIAENEAQIALFRRRIADIEDEARTYKNESQRLSGEIFRLQNEIQNEAFQKSACELEKMALDDEIAYLKQTNEAELNELRSKSVNSDLDPSLFFRNELAQAIRDIRRDYETLLENQRNNLQNQYSMFSNEIIIHNQRPDVNPLLNEHYQREVERKRTDLLQSQNQNSQLQAKIAQMKATMDDLLRRLNSLNDKDAQTKAKHEQDMAEAKEYLARVSDTYEKVMALKTSLEKEIAIYRQQLEGPSGLQGCVDRIVQKAYEKPSSDITAQPTNPPSSTTTTSVSRTTINKTGSNYSFRPSTGIADLVNQPTSVPSQSERQTYTATYKMPTAPTDNVKRDSMARPPFTAPQDNIYDNTTRQFSVRPNSNYASQRSADSSAYAYMEPEPSRQTAYSPLPRQHSYDDNVPDPLYENIDDQGNYD